MQLTKIIAAVICCTVLTLCSFGQQTPYLEKPVTIRQSTISYEELFKQLSNQTGVVFSYTNFDASRKVTVKGYSRKQLRVVLNDLFEDGSIAYKMKGRYVILTVKKITQAKPQAQPDNNIVVNGYIYDAVDSTLVAESSVYLRQNRQAAVTDEYGYFSLSFPKTSDVLTINVAKENYEDTSVVILSRQRNTIVIYLQPKAAPVSITIDDTIQVVYQPVDTVPQTAPVVAEDSSNTWLNEFWARFRARHSNLRNITDTFFTNTSFSLFPPLSTNRLLAINTVNRLSFNGLVGYSKGVELFEIGGLVNVDFGNVKYAQVGGLVNLVSGNMTGFQLAGLVNTVGGRVDGMQVAGLVNVNRKSINGVQLAGLVNVADTVRGLQLAGIANKANKVMGVQWAGLYNRADYLKGCQLGFINSARVATGTPIGFLSFVRTGYHKLELAYDENGMATFAFRTGVDRFHNILFAGLRPFDKYGDLWTFGYGLGTSKRITEKWRIGFDWTEQNFQIPLAPISLNLLSKAYIGVEWRPYKYFNITAGPTFNLLVSDLWNENSSALQVYSRIRGTSLSATAYQYVMARMWIGWKVAVRFL